MELLEKLASLRLDIPLTMADLNNPQPAMVQRIYRTILVKFFDIPEMGLTQPNFEWVTQDMQKEPDLYSRSEPFILITRIIQSIINDYLNLGEDVPQVGVGHLVDPKPRETKTVLNQLAIIAKIRQTARAHYEREESALKAQTVVAEQMEQRLEMKEERLQRLKKERAIRLTIEKQLHETKEKRSARLAQLSRMTTEAEERLEMVNENLARQKDVAKSKESERSALARKANDMNYDIIDDPEALKDEVEELRARKVEQQRVLDHEMKECRELESRDENCRQAARTMGNIEGEMGNATNTVARLVEATRDKHDKEAALEEKQELLQSKKEGVEKKRKEREAFKDRHEEERTEQRGRLNALAGQIAAVRAECERLKGLEGSVKKSVVEQRQKLARLKNEKNAMVSELISYTQARMELLEKLEKKMAEKQSFLRQLEAAYEQGKTSLDDAMTTSDLNVSVTTTHTMQLLD